MNKYLPIFIFMSLLYTSSRCEEYPVTPQLYGIDLLQYDIPITTHPYCEYPDIAIDQDGKIWIVFTELKNDLERISLVGYKDTLRTDSLEISSEKGYEFRPRITIDEKNRVWVVWAAKRSENWDIYARYLYKNNLSEEIRITQNPGDDLNPSICAVNKNEIMVSFITNRKGNFDIYAAKIKKGLPQKPFPISEDPHNEYRPSLLADPEENVFIVYDRQIKGDYRVYFRKIAPKGSPSPLLISPSLGSNLAASMDIKPDGGIIIAFQSDIQPDGGRGLTPWICFREIRDNRLSDLYTLAETGDQLRSGEDQGFEFPTVKSFRDKIFISGRPSQGFSLEGISGMKKSPVYRIEKKGWGGRGQYLRFAIHKDQLFLVRRDLRYIYLSRIVISPIISAAKAGIKTIQTAHITTPEKKYRNPDDFKTDNDYQVLFGDIHQHSSLSDGMGPVDYCFTRSKYLQGHDFAALTDHEWFTGNAILPSEWEWIKIVGKTFQNSDSLMVFYAYEWTTPRLPKGFGHKNVYSIDDDFPLIGLSTGYKNTPDLFKAVKGKGAFAVPHHIGWTGVDWENHDEIAQPVVEVVSTHGAFEYMGNEPIAHRGGMPGNFIQDGLAQGLRFGVIGSSDGHGLLWHHGIGWKANEWETGLAAALVKEKTKSAIFGAFKSRRVYATSGTPIFLDFRINDHPMGEAFSTDAPPEIYLYVRGTGRMKYAYLIRDNREIVAAGKDLDEGKGVRIRFRDKNIQPGNHFYYVRFIQENGEMAWSSPIFITYSPPDN